MRRALASSEALLVCTTVLCKTEEPAAQERPGQQEGQLKRLTEPHGTGHYETPTTATQHVCGTGQHLEGQE